jgi:SAM-dependent methyltransferase
MTGWKVRREDIERDLNSFEQKRYLSPFFYGQREALLPLLQEHANGRLIDVGCGVMPFRSHLEPLVECYHGLDLYPRSGQIALIGDVQDMSMISDASYDTSICLEVLEHLPDPFLAVAEIFRILRPGGVLIGSVPHLSRLHEEPHDYYRYTRHGLRVILERAGFDVDTIKSRGGICSFLGHQISTLLIVSTWRVPLLGQLTWLLNKYTITMPAYFVDRKIDADKIFALGYVFVAYKRDTAKIKAYP